MNTQAIATPCWSTASFGSSADTSSMELFALGEHLDLCKGCRGRLFALQCAAEAVNSFVAARVVTTLSALALLIGAIALVF
jgi:hypothetical protein